MNSPVLTGGNSYHLLERKITCTKFFRHIQMHENCALLGYYADSVFLALEDGTENLFRNFGVKVSLIVA
jgi:hypothetical protein